MPLTLRAVSLNDQPITQPIVASFGAQGGSLGRADTNTLALPDPERRISRLQAEIRVVGSGYVIKNVGAANPIIVRDKSLTQGESAPLKPGDQLRIGGYLLEVAADDRSGDEPTTIEPAQAFSDPFAAPQSPPPAPRPSTAMKPSSSSAPAFPASSPFAALGGPISAANPFAELLGDSNAPSPGSLPSSREASGAPSRLPDDFDPFAAPSPPERASPPPTSTGGGVFDDLIPSAAPASIDSLFGLTSDNARDPLAAFMADAPPVRDPFGKPEPGRSLPTDPLALFGSDKDARVSPPPGETPPDQTPELRAAFVPPKPRAAVQGGARSPSARALDSPADALPAPAQLPTAAEVRRSASAYASADVAASGSRARSAAPPAPSTASAEEPTVPPAPGWSADALATWNYLCEGAGVRLDPPPNTGPAFMRVVGMMLRAAVEGTVQQMAMRQATRQELQAQVTVIRPRNNNPLKFAPDGQSAMEQVLQPAVRGFLPGPAAMTDAMNDLLGHAIGTMAGTRAALEGVLKRFGPQELEAKLASKSVLDSVLPMNRKSKLWELYLQHYESIRDEAQDDFHTLFGRAFLAAYEQQLERLRREKAAAAAAPK
jgi:FHA domain-containing protein